MGYEVSSIETMAEKRAVLERAAGEGAWILLEHDPTIALGRPRVEGDDFGWAETVPAADAAVAGPATTSPGIAR
jgi:hypothetical protein